MISIAWNTKYHWLAAFLKYSFTILIVLLSQVLAYSFYYSSYCTSNRPKGTITIDNENYKRYNEEFQITMVDLKSDERVNVLAHLKDEDICLLKYITGDIKFKFIED